ncbi:MAG: marine proteobacterial sortase target protein [Chromatiaceae bacterium]|nr:marine proteobacterial sortase target protein [Chromatiaceae bacterium]
MLDQQRDNIFTTSVANIPPGETLRVEIEYQQQLQWRDGEFTLRFPTVVGPRYIPGTPLAAAAHGSGGHGWAPDTDQVPDASRITPPVVTGADSRFNALSISALLDTGIALSELSSAYHPIAVAQLRPGRYRVTLASGDVPAERDFVLRWRPVLAAQPSAALFSEHWRGQDYALLMLMPPQQSAIPQHIARELVLVVDTSGSMHGDSIEQARAALLNALQRLRPGDRFNVVQFSDQVRALYGQAAPADPAHLEQARRYVRGLQAAGGTEMLPALRHALHDPVPSGLLRQVVFITDGAVGNEQALFRALVDEIGASRLFTVGIGSAPNALFMRKAAAFGRGSFTYIGSTGEVEQRVATLFRQLSMPVLTDVRLHWQTQDAARPPLQTPQAVPDLYAGEPLVVALQARALPHRVEIEGRLGAQPWRQTLELPQTMAPGGTLAGGVHVLWARRMIDDWMARLLTGDPPDRVREAVLALALDHHLVSRYTSLVAVDHTPTRPDASGFATAAVPARLPAGWSAAAVFGRLPGTATPAALYLLIGLAGLAVATLLARWRA